MLYLIFIVFQEGYYVSGFAMMLQNCPVYLVSIINAVAAILYLSGCIGKLSYKLHKLPSKKKQTIQKKKIDFGTVFNDIDVYKQYKLAIALEENQ